jgi:hypothetical protein
MDSPIDMPAGKVFPHPGGKVGSEAAGAKIFPVIAASQRVFNRGGVVHEVDVDPTGKKVLVPITAQRFVAVIETFGARVARREEDSDGGVKWRSCTLTRGAAETLLVTDAARAHLPPIVQVVACPVIVEGPEPGSCRVLTKGYHGHQGGTYITCGEEPPHVPLEAAQQAIADLLYDFDFASAADASRAVASLISPALKMGGLINDDYPLDLAEADQSQSGKTFRQRLAVAVFNGEAETITQNKGGVGSMDEAVAAALIRGRPFIVIDNVRGRVDSELLESALRGHGAVTCRTLRQRLTVNCRPFLWYLSTNGAQLTRDLANRSIVTRIRKRPDDHTFRSFPEGDLLAHVQANQPFFQGAVFAIVREWVRQGKPRTNESRHDFRTWVQSMDWIVREIFGLPPLMDGHREEQLRTANPQLQWLRDVALAAKAGGQVGVALATSDLCSIAEDAGIEFPGNPASREDSAQRAGKVLGRLFRESEGRPVSVDRFEVRREQISTLNRAIGEWRDKPFYTFSEVP